VPTTKHYRRAFLRNTALMAIAAPFVRTLTAEAQVVEPCLVLLFHGNGHRRGQWASRRSDSDFDLGRIAAPLAPHRDKMILFRGLNHDAMKRSTWARTKHGKGSGIAFTGTAVTSEGWPTGPSVDQYIVSRGVRTRIPSIQLGAGVGDTNAYGRIVYAAEGRAIAPVQVPLEAYRTLFSGAVPSEGDAARRLLARRRSLLDFARRDVCDLDRALGVEDRRRLDAHCEAIREVERSLAEDLSSSTCEAPADLHGERANAGTYERVLDQHIALLTIALSCGMTRVGSLALGQAHGGLVSDAADAPTGSHHEASHHRSHVGGDEAYVRISEWYARRVAALLARLDAVATREDGTLLDHTLLVWGTDIADGEDHSEEDVPWAVFGGGSLGIRGGRMLDVSGRNANDLLISACHAMGLRDVETFGHADLCRGPLPLG
jgi:hypothetical protein